MKKLIKREGAKHGTESMRRKHSFSKRIERFSKAFQDVPGGEFQEFSPSSKWYFFFASLNKLFISSLFFSEYSSFRMQKKREGEEKNWIKKSRTVETRPRHLRYVARSYDIEEVRGDEAFEDFQQFLLQGISYATAALFSMTGTWPMLSIQNIDCDTITHCMKRLNARIFSSYWDEQ